MPIESSHSGPPWVLIAGGFHRRGGMDRANLALAKFLASRGTPVHLVAYEVDEDLAQLPGVTVHRVYRPANSFLLGHRLLDREGRKVAAQTTAQYPQARAVVNGGNCRWPDVNWVHSVHQAWPVHDEGAPLWFKGKNRITKILARSDERSALRCARIVIANSQRTRRDLIERLGVPPDRVTTVYLAIDQEFRPASRTDRERIRVSLGKSPGRPLAAFVGVLGHDTNKGFDILWSAWQRLCTDPDWDVDLLVAGAGRTVEGWRERIESAGLADRVKLLGFSERISELLGAVDVLVSPVRYEAYGLNVHEALACGAVAIVSRCAGIAERFPEKMTPLLLDDPENVEALIKTLRLWRSDIAQWRTAANCFGAQLRSRSWDDMASEFVETVERRSAHA